MTCYLVVSCVDANCWDVDLIRNPIKIIPENNIPALYLSKGYELYKILPTGNLKIVKQHDEKISRKGLTGIKI